MARKMVTKYMVRTADTKILVRKGFDTWEDAYNWKLIHDWGQYGQPLAVFSYTARA